MSNMLAEKLEQAHRILAEFDLDAWMIFVRFGVKHEGFCSDLQRCWYVPREGETAPPAAAQKAFDAVVNGITAGAAALKPGVEGWQVDAAARGVIAAAGYPEYGHALGHHVGRTAHDGAGLLGPRWERYGLTPFRKVEPGNVFTLEPSIENAGGAGCLGIEEMVVVTSTGCEWLSHRQTMLPCLRNSY